MRTVLVTGANGGIGAAIVGELHERGHQIIALGRDAARLEDLAVSFPRVVRWVAADLRRPEALAGLVGDVEHLDGLVHNAAVAPVASVADTPYAMWQDVLTVNVVAAAELTRLLLPALRAAAGHVIFINAAPGVHAVPRWSAYAASKAALRELADSLREEEAPNNVRVTTVYPPGTATGLLERVRAEFGQPYDPDAAGSPQSVAAHIVNALESTER
ncbi:SDR family oxidoreductase [Actinomadura rubrisoli]|uniref:SDR family oxidoreductase n=1 Tax=Actinomadura rubrisoli TaxID=2530368 RepID=A0A4V2YYI6_9ACTN|nr:SDR family oxidoreductase [Actinomadura rubrisoli]TDD93367.1 SDR family oxidoreductase [Actinomadura rubrisoli]